MTSQVTFEDAQEVVDLLTENGFIVVEPEVEIGDDGQSLDFDATVVPVE